MSKTFRTLALCLAALVLLSGSYALVLALLPEEDSPDSSSSSDVSSSDVSSSVQTYMYEYDYGDFVSVEVQSVNVGTYLLYKDGSDYVIDELEDIKHYEAMLETCSERFCKYPYSDIKNEAPTAEDLEEYGLTEPQAQATATFTEGSETLYVGNKTEDGYYYVRLEGSETVYLVSSGISTYFINGYLSFVNTTLFSCAEDYRSGIFDITFNDTLVNDPLCISRTDADSKSAMQISSSYMIVSPVEMAVDSEKLDTGLTELSSFAAEKAVALISDNSQLADYGLDNPAYTLEFYYQKPLTDSQVEEGYTNETNPNEKKKYKFLFSKEDENGTVYVKASGSNLIMSFTKSVYSFFDWSLDSMAGDTFISPMIKYLDRMVVVFDGKEYVFELTSGDGSITAVSYMGRQLDVSNFKKYYQVVLGTGRIGTGQAEENAATHMEIRFDYLDELDKEDDVLTFKEFSLRQYAAEINGVGRFTIAKTRMDKLERDLIKVINNEPVTAFMN